MGSSVRRAARELSEAILISNRQIVNLTIGNVSAMHMVDLEVKCHRCSRHGHYRLAGLLKRYGPELSLTDFERIVAGDCAHFDKPLFYSKCGVYLPGVCARTASVGGV